MAGKVNITVLIENVASGLLFGEHGLAWHIETPRHRLLFDTGRGVVLAENARQLGIDLSSVDTIALSHGHYDHSGGLTQVLAAAPSAKVYAHPAAICTRYSRRDEVFVEIGLPRLPVHWSDIFVPVTSPREACHGVWLTGPVPRTCDFEVEPTRFFRDSAGREADPFDDDQALYFDTPDGVVVLLGCAHAGVINTVRYVQQLCPSRPILAVMGGMHLSGAGEDRILATVDALRDIAPVMLAPNHCTGQRATIRLGCAFGEAVVPAATGKRFAFEVL